MHKFQLMYSPKNTFQLFILDSASSHWCWCTLCVGDVVLVRSIFIWIWRFSLVSLNHVVNYCFHTHITLLACDWTRIKRVKRVNKHPSQRWKQRPINVQWSPETSLWSAETSFHRSKWSVRSFLTTMFRFPFKSRFFVAVFCYLYCFQKPFPKEGWKHTCYLEAIFFLLVPTSFWVLLFLYYYSAPLIFRNYFLGELINSNWDQFFLFVTSVVLHILVNKFLDTIRCIVLIANPFAGHLKFLRNSLQHIFSLDN